MQIRLLTGLSGPQVSYGPGEVIDWPNEEAVRLIERGMAEPVREQAVETQVDKRSKERAVTRRVRED